MSRTISNQVDNRAFGPRDQQMEPPWEARRPPFWRPLIAWFFGAMFLHSAIDNGGSGEFMWCVHVLILGWAAKWLVRAVQEDRMSVRWLVRLAFEVRWGVPIFFARHAPLFLIKPVHRHRVNRRRLEPEPHVPTAADARYAIECRGGGAYLGVYEDGEWATAEPESGTMVIGPPRRGKTTAVIIPTILGASGPLLSTATKPEVMESTMRARGEIGQIWWFDPAGEVTQMPDGVRRLHWSPIAASTTWDDALLTAHAMTECTRTGAGTTNESHWTERAETLLSPLLYAANLMEGSIEDVMRWTHHHDLGPSLEVLASSEDPIAADALIGIQRTDSRERSSIFSTTAGVLRAYKSNGARQTAKDPNFDPDAFVCSTDTIYITSPDHKQRACEPLIVGLVEGIRHRVYHHAAIGTPGIHRMVFELDEFGNVIKLPNILELASQAGGQGLDLVIVIQDLVQVATRYGQQVAEAFLSMFQTKLLFPGINDVKTLDAVSALIGDYDRQVVSSSTGQSESEEWLSATGSNQSFNYQTQRQRLVTAADIAQLRQGQALLLRGADHELIRLTRWFEMQPFASIGDHPRSRLAA
ncbi:MAG: type IV secretory system conjugative DNA transfer family protein [Solirubrobacteraceae bacterium]